MSDRIADDKRGEAPIEEVVKPQYWRLIGRDDILQEGDEWSEKGKAIWNLVNPTCFGNDIGHWDRCYDFRRRVSPVAKNATTDKESLTVAVCPQCGHEDGWHNIECWKQRAEKAEALQSNCNSALKIAIEMLEETKAKLHQAEKINAEASRSAVRLSSDAAARILQAEKERDEARRKATALNGVRNQMANAFNASDAKAFWDADDRANSLVEEWTPDLAMALAQRDQLRAENERLRNHLELILPMAKGYAYQNPVGNNLQMVMDAQQALAAKGETK